jgi:segregation and condensation protein A
VKSCYNNPVPPYPYRHSPDDYIVTTDLFEGPLDLLLDLIEKAQLDITRLALAQVTDQYLAYLHKISEQNAEEVSSFLVIAAKLLQIKSEALLPRPTEREPSEEDPGEALARQLIAYRKFKRAAEWLLQRFENHQQTYLRIAAPPKTEGRVDMSGITLNDLVEAALSVYRARNEIPLLNTVVAVPKITLREKIQLIMANLKATGQQSFRALLGGKHTRLDTVVTFLAILELIKRKIVTVEQDKLFSDIIIQPLSDWNPGEDFDLEFGD